MKIKPQFLTLIAMLNLSFCIYAQTSQDLQDEILKMDGVLFHAFNTCNLKVMGEVFDQDLQFEVYLQKQIKK